MAETTEEKRNRMYKEAQEADKVRPKIMPEPSEEVIEPEAPVRRRGMSTADKLRLRGAYNEYVLEQSVKGKQAKDMEDWHHALGQ